MSKITKQKVYVAMSGGVDSSVATTLLKKQGYNVVGVYMKPWAPESMSRICPWKQDREDAMRAASILDIPFSTWDFSKEYKRGVADYMIREYKAGRTPNPDVMCNKYIKFGLFLEKALAEGADYIATGHYVRRKAYKLLTAKDKNKDQSYFLWTLTQKELKHCLFPIGDYIKPDVRKMAKKLGLPNHDKKDSQGVCFIGPVDVKEFLKKYIKAKKGRILDPTGNIIGEHDGVYYYTIGQRHGLDIKNGKGPYYVTGKDLKKNIIYVGGEKDLYSREFRIEDLGWINKPKLPARLDVKIRYRNNSNKAVLSSNGSIKFLKPQKSITSGQSAVFYRGQEILGGGIIK